MKLGRESLFAAIRQSDFFSRVSTLLELYPWNNFLQLKVIGLYEDLLEGGASKDFRKAALEGSRIGPTLIGLGSQTSFDHGSGRNIRHGHMATVVRLANLLVKHRGTHSEVGDYLDGLGDDWVRFAEGELKRSNDTNNRSLGGQQPRPSSNEDDDMEGSMSMDSILSRFSNFSTERSKREAANEEEEEDEEEEDEESEPHKEHTEEPDEDKLTLNTAEAAPAKEAERPGTPAIAPLVKEFTDNNYWKVDYIPSGQTIEDLMAELAL